MDKASKDNKANQGNPNHEKTGPGHKAGYHGEGTKEDLDNHSQQIQQNKEGKC
ncbi:hypothetical protein WH47_04617 [Habropoda laboriosa]|uniref:Uncharacterized protein n=1 Tax=Habropoda laboriosa TaxID=597456 RepID=A0A0L7R2C3_9HYME|nr:hypothetical protein WH47_04617 [Habropoda laboriosa]